MSKNEALHVMGCLRTVLALIIGSATFAHQFEANAEGAPAAPSTAGISTQRVLPAPATALPAPTWSTLSPAQKTALMPLERDWDALDTSSRSKWLSIATRYAVLPADEQARMHERMRAWARLSPAQRQQARIAFHAAQHIAAGQRQAKWESYQALPPEKRQELADMAVQKRVAKPPTRRPVAGDSPEPKSNLVPATLKAQSVESVAPSILQAKPGATTVFIARGKTTPAHQQAGQTKVFADPDLVDSKTLLPKRHVIAVVP